MLENWRNFPRAHLALPDRLFLVGPAACGKSNFLDALRFLRDVVAHGLQEAVARRGGVGRLRCLSARQRPGVRIGLRVRADDFGPDWSYLLTFSQDSLQRPFVLGETLMRGKEVILQRPDEADRSHPERLSRSWWEHPRAQRTELAEFLTAIRYVHAVPQRMRDPLRSSGPEEDADGSDLLAQIARTPPRVQAARLRQLSHALGWVVPQLGDLELWRDRDGMPHLRGRFAHWRSHAGWQTEAELSDGVLRLLSMVWAAQDAPGLLLIEEPELGLHGAVIRRLPALLQALRGRRGSQLLLSTHAASLLEADGVSPEEVFLLIPEREGTRIRRAQNLSEARALLEAPPGAFGGDGHPLAAGGIRQLSLFPEPAD
ncbi:MAG TPA: ATP-binding protein [Limnochordia bacterium]